MAFGKTVTAAILADACLTCPEMKSAGADTIIVSSSFNQSLIAFRQLLAGREWNKKDFRVQNSPAVAAITCRHTGARVRVIGSDPRRAHGLQPNLIIADEPAQWSPTSADRMIAALRTSLGKTGADGGRLLAIGTRPSGGDTSDHWFARMLAGEAAGYTQCHAASPDDDPADEEVWHAANPSLKHFPALLARMRLEVKDALRSPQLMASFKALRLNMGCDDTVVNVLIDAETWLAAEGAAERRGDWVLGLDAASTTAMSAAAGYWPETGRAEALACFPEEPGLAERGLRDGVGDRYVEMARRGELIQRGRHVSAIDGLLTEVVARWGVPACVVSDKWREAAVREHLEAIQFPHSAAYRTRRNGYFDGHDDIFRFRSALLSGEVTPVKSLLLRSAMAEARVRTDDAGNCRISTGHAAGRRAAARDDAACALVLAVGEASRSFRKSSPVAEKVVVF